MTKVYINTENENVKHKAGNYYIDYNRNLYMLCATSTNKAAIVSLQNGNRWRDAVTIAEQDHITEKEFQTITGNIYSELKLVGKVEINVK